MLKIALLFLLYQKEFALLMAAAAVVTRAAAVMARVVAAAQIATATIKQFIHIHPLMASAITYTNGRNIFAEARFNGSHRINTFILAVSVRISSEMVVVARSVQQGVST
ncbi:MAG: hypothetical protein AB1631_16220 [Acidobacteriota bacterium]